MKKQFVKYIGLNMISMVAMSCYILADTLFIANGVGSLGLTALNLVLPIYNVIFGIGLLLGVGGATRFSILKGQGNITTGQQIFTMTFKVGLVIALCVMTLGYCFAPTIVSCLQATGSVYTMALAYLRGFILFTPFFIGQQMMLCFLRNDDNPRLASIMMLVGTGFNIICDYIFIFTFDLGMTGAALATGCSPVIGLIISSLHFIMKKNQIRFVHCQMMFQEMKHIIQIGIPSLMSEFSSGIIVMVFNTVILTMSGDIGVASYGIVSNIAIVVSSLFSGLSQGVQPLISLSYGRQDLQAVKKYLHMAIGVSFTIAMVVIVVMCFYNQGIVLLFNQDHNQTMERIARAALPIYFAGYLFSGVNMTMMSYFSAQGDVKPSSLISLLRSGIVIIPLVLILSSLFSLTGVWLSYPMSEAIVCIVACFFYRYKKRLV